VARLLKDIQIDPLASEGTPMDFVVEVVDRREAVITHTTLSVFSPEWARECAECLLAAYRRRGGVAARILNHRGEELYRL
jgi:hypothetical protein